jgi:hypothetical protein
MKPEQDGLRAMIAKPPSLREHKRDNLGEFDDRFVPDLMLPSNFISKGGEQ